MSKKNRSLFQVNVPVGRMPPQKVRSYVKTFTKKMRKALKEHGDVVITPYRGDTDAEKVEIIRLV